MLTGARMVEQDATCGAPPVKQASELVSCQSLKSKIYAS
jgi:hypothetical protein